jgi:2-polyprenyl-3-methyl-5-hydroxy-6-metoxy-1,4-benzoquinol methylase
MHNKLIGEYKPYDKCRSCSSSNIQTVINLGFQPLAGGFIKALRKQNIEEKFYPLEINFCKNCLLLQTNVSIDPDTLFKKYFYVSSSIKTLVSHFETQANELIKIFPDPSRRFIVEIGCNDGTFIKSLIKNDFKTLGVDPATNIVKPAITKGLPIMNDYFSSSLAKKIARSHGKADAIFGFHSLAHIENMHDVLKGVKYLLKKDGFLAMEVHYLAKLIKDMQYDMIYHEHQFYYSLLSLKNFIKQYELEVFDVKRFDIRAGSIMFFIQNTKGGSRVINKEIRSLIETEKKYGLHKIETFIKFARNINLRRTQLVKLLQRLKKEHKKVAGYGASGRGTVIANYCGLKDYLNYVVDDAPSKHGALIPGTHHRIYPSSKITRDRVDYALLFAWPFYKEVKSKNIYFKGKFIIPLPKVRII